MPNLDKLVEEIMAANANLIADALVLIAMTQYEAEPDALYSGVEVGASLRGYARAIKERGA